MCSIFSPSRSGEISEAIKQLKAAVFLGTIENGLGKGDAGAIEIINGALKERPQLMKDAVALIKARIKDRCVSISALGLDVLDQCMKSNGYEFQAYVSKKVLNRILKLSVPHKGTHPQIQRKAANLIREWGTSLGTDSRLSDFSRAAADLEKKSGDASSSASTVSSPRTQTRPKTATNIHRPHSWPNAKSPEAAQAVASARRRSCTDLSALSGMEVVALAKTSQQAIMDQMQATRDPTKLRTLQGLHDQLSADLDVFYANMAAADANRAAEEQALRAPPAALPGSSAARN
jgi:hypothetical protein